MTSVSSLMRKAKPEWATDPSEIAALRSEFTSLFEEQSTIRAERMRVKRAGGWPEISDREDSLVERMNEIEGRLGECLLARLLYPVTA